MYKIYIDWPELTEQQIIDKLIYEEVYYKYREDGLDIIDYEIRRMIEGGQNGNNPRRNKTD